MLRMSGSAWYSARSRSTNGDEHARRVDTTDSNTMSSAVRRYGPLKLLQPLLPWTSVAENANSTPASGGTGPVSSAMTVQAVPANSTPGAAVADVAVTVGTALADAGADDVGVAAGVAGGATPTRVQADAITRTVAATTTPARRINRPAVRPPGS